MNTNINTAKLLQETRANLHNRNYPTGGGHMQLQMSTVTCGLYGGNCQIDVCPIYVCFLLIKLIGVWHAKMVRYFSGMQLLELLYVCKVQ